MLLIVCFKGSYWLCAFSYFICCLQSSYTWAEHLNHRVYKEWKSTAAKRLRDMVWKAMDEEITEWMPTELKKRVQALRETDAFKKRSEQNRKNKTTGPKAGTLHTSGSISASQWARRLVVSFNNYFVQNNFLRIPHVLYVGNWHLISYFINFFPYCFH